MIYFIPGAGETKKDYEPLFSALKKYKIKFLDLHIDDVFELPAFSENDVIIGFSVGAVVAYLAVCNKNLASRVGHLILCSPPPIIVRAKRPRATKISILIGKKEHQIMKTRGEVLAKKWKSTLALVKAGHDVNEEAYIKELNFLLSSD